MSYCLPWAIILLARVYARLYLFFSLLGWRLSSTEVSDSVVSRILWFLITSSSLIALEFKAVICVKMGLHKKKVSKTFDSFSKELISFRLDVKIAMLIFCVRECTTGTLGRDLWGLDRLHGIKWNLKPTRLFFIQNSTQSVSATTLKKTCSECWEASTSLSFFFKSRFLPFF